MHPVLLELFGLKINTYGFMIAMGFLSAMWLGSRLFREIGLNPEKFVDIAFWSLVSGILGARGLYIITRWDSFASNPLSILYIWEGGLVFFGGLIVAGIFDILYIRKQKLPFWKTVDILSMAVVTGHAFGRIGCFFAGCCHGKATESFLGIKFFSDLVDPALQGISVHPTQLYESFSITLKTFFISFDSPTKSPVGNFTLGAE